MARRKPDRRALEAELARALAARGATESSVEDVELLHRLGEAYGCFAPRDLERANELYERALRLLWAAEGDVTPRALSVLASWIDCAHARRERAEGSAAVLIERAIRAMSQRAEASLAEIEPRLLANDPDARAHYSGAYALLCRLGQQSRALALLHASTDAWRP